MRETATQVMKNEYYFGRILRTTRLQLADFSSVKLYDR